MNGVGIGMMKRPIEEGLNERILLDQKLVKRKYVGVEVIYPEKTLAESLQEVQDLH